MLSTQKFRTIVYDYYRKHKRSFAWRNINNPYYIVVSEIMLQQTQTFRVEQKFEQFVRVLPTFCALAQAPFALVLSLWKGLGYNRRALYLQQIVRDIIDKYYSRVPDDPTILEQLPGIGPATARSIVVFAYNKPEVFIETNIRTVFLHHFFAEKHKVADKELYPLVKKTLDVRNPRQWYYALMDYGVLLKKRYKNPARRSKHHVIQLKFEGSDRQIRGKILEALLHYKTLSFDELYEIIACDYERLAKIVARLIAEKIVMCAQDLYLLRER